jgi:hypothetical protein
MFVFALTGMTPKLAQINGRSMGFSGCECLAKSHLGIVPETVAPGTDQISRFGKSRMEKLSTLIRKPTKKRSRA